MSVVLGSKACMGHYLTVTFELTAKRVGQFDGTLLSNALSWPFFGIADNTWAYFTFTRTAVYPAVSLSEPGSPAMPASGLGWSGPDDGNANLL